ncbi:MAG TPA: asparagine synthase C-terminal domain-containing protein, partial [Nitrososphaerales archaeon]|nr:asparagine synthase C-terminal domain-containing protein [Nitrososphaerales archaeon]
IQMNMESQPTLMDRSLWCLYSAVARTASGAGAEVILLGQLADELFGGYAKYERILASLGERQAAECMDRDIEGYMTKGMVRDRSACSAWLEPRFPFVGEAVIEFGRSIPMSFKIRNGVRKAVLREAATILGLPVDIAGAAKKAAQYSSGIQKVIRSSRF